jgi:hypothetical protein
LVALTFKVPPSEPRFPRGFFFFGGQQVTRLEQRGAVAFTGAGIAAVVILLITLWEYLF